MEDQTVAAPAAAPDVLARDLIRLIENEVVVERYVDGDELAKMVNEGNTFGRLVSYQQQNVDLFRMVRVFGMMDRLRRRVDEKIEKLAKALR